MSNRKATFAKRQRETELKDHAKAKEERRMNRKSQNRVGKGPEIAWDQAVDVSTTPYGDGPAPPPEGVAVPPPAAPSAPPAGAAPAAPTNGANDPPKQP